MGASVYFLMSHLVLAGVLTETGGSHVQPVLSGPSWAYLRSRVQFRCEVPGFSSPLTYELRKDEDLIATEFNRMLLFSLKVTEGSEGKYYCRLTTGGQTSNTLHLQAVIPVQGASLSSEPDPPVVYEGERLVLHCHVIKGTHLSFTWYHNKQEVTSFSEIYQLSENTLTVETAVEQHAGIYSCTAQNQMDINPRYSSSQNLNVFVKKYISSPRLTFSVVINGSDLLANMSCRLDRGSPPVTFIVLLNGVEMYEKSVTSLETCFLLPISVDLNMGTAQCKAKTEKQQLTSDPVHLKVVPVGGAVQIMVTYLHDADGVVTAARLTCVPSRGSFPAFSWSLNHTSLHAHGDSHAVSERGQILIITHINTESSGYYRCAVRDGFNNSSSWLESPAVLIQMTDFRVMPVEVVALVFCGFLSMVIVGGTFCVLWNIKCEAVKHHNNQGGNQSETIIDTGVPIADVPLQTQTTEMKTVVVEYEV